MDDDRATSSTQSIDSVTCRLLDYFGAVGDPRGHVFTLRDINLQVMMNVYAASERAVLVVALAGLVEAGDLHPITPTSYRLTDAGLRRAGIMRPHAGRRADSGFPASRQAPRPA